MVTKRSGFNVKLSELRRTLLISAYASFGKGRLIFRVTFRIVTNRASSLRAWRRRRMLHATFWRIDLLSVLKETKPKNRWSEETKDLNPNRCFSCLSRHFGKTNVGQRFKSVAWSLFIQRQLLMFLLHCHFLFFELIPRKFAWSSSFKRWKGWEGLF